MAGEPRGIRRRQSFGAIDDASETEGNDRRLGESLIAREEESAVVKRFQRGERIQGVGRSTDEANARSTDGENA